MDFRVHLTIHPRPPGRARLPYVYLERSGNIIGRLVDVLAEVTVKSHPELSLEEGEEVGQGALHADPGAPLQERLGGLPRLVGAVQTLRTHPCAKNHRGGAQAVVGGGGGVRGIWRNASDR